MQKPRVNPLALLPVFIFEWQARLCSISHFQYRGVKFCVARLHFESTDALMYRQRCDLQHSMHRGKSSYTDSCLYRVILVCPQRKVRAALAF